MWGTCAYTAPLLALRLALLVEPQAVLCGADLYLKGLNLYCGASLFLRR